MAYSKKSFDEVRDLTFTDAVKMIASEKDSGSHVDLAEPYGLDMFASLVLDTYWAPMLRVVIEPAPARHETPRLDEVLQSIQYNYSGVLSSVGSERHSGSLYLHARLNGNHFEDRIGVFCDEYATPILTALANAVEEAR